MLQESSIESLIQSSATAVHSGVNDSFASPGLHCQSFFCCCCCCVQHDGWTNRPPRLSTYAIKHSQDDWQCILYVTENNNQFESSLFHFQLCVLSEREHKKYLCAAFNILFFRSCFDLLRGNKDHEQTKAKVLDRLHTHTHTMRKNSVEMLPYLETSLTSPTHVTSVFRPRLYRNLKSKVKCHASFTLHLMALENNRPNMKCKRSCSTTI